MCSVVPHAWVRKGTPRLKNDEIFEKIKCGLNPDSESYLQPLTRTYTISNLRIPPIFLACQPLAYIIKNHTNKSNNYLSTCLCKSKCLRQCVNPEIIITNRNYLRSFIQKYNWWFNVAKYLLKQCNTTYRYVQENNLPQVGCRMQV